MYYKIAPNIDEIILCDSEDFRVVLTIVGDDLIVCNRYISNVLMPLPSNYRTKERAEKYINALLNNGWLVTCERFCDDVS